MIIKKKVLWLAVLMLMAGTMSACGNNAEKSTDSADASDTADVADSADDSGSLESSGSSDYVYVDEVDVSEYVTLGEYKGIELTETPVSISQEDVQQYIDTYLLASYAVEIPVEDRTDVQEGDTANIDYVGYRDGVAFDGGTAQGYNLVIGSGQFIPGFEAGLIGANVGDTVSLDLTFPENYTNAEMAGAEVTFEVTINSISISQLPELTDELVEELAVGDCTTVEELNSYLNDSFYSSAVSSYNQTVKNDITSAVMANCTFEEELPEKLVTRYYDVLIDDMTTTAASYGMDLNTYVQNYYYMGEEEYTEIVKNNAQTMAKQYIMFKAIADAEDLNLTEEEQMNAIEEMAAAYGYESVETLLESIDRDDLNEYIMAEEVVAFLIDNAVINAD